MPPRDAHPRQLLVAPAGTWCGSLGFPKPPQSLLGLGMLGHGCSCTWPCQGLSSGHRAMIEIPADPRGPEPRSCTIPVFPAKPSSAAPRNQPIPWHCLLSQAPAASPRPGRMQDPGLTPVFSKMKGKHADLGCDFPSRAFVGWGFPPGLLSKALPAAAPAEGQIPVPRAGDGAGSGQEQPSGTAIPGAAAFGSCHVLGKRRVPPTPSKAIKALN